MVITVTLSQEQTRIHLFHKQNGVILNNKKCVLIVEDERLTAADLERTLKGLGYNVVANVATGEDAIASASSLVPELVLMDIRLRGRMDGIEAGSRIREQWGIPIIFLSAYPEEACDTASPLIKKPFSVKALVAALDGVSSLAPELPQVSP